MATFMKILGWTIGAAVAVKLLTTQATGTVVQNIGTAWAGIVKAITGG